MEIKSVFGRLKKIDFVNYHVSLAIIKEYKKDRISQYSIKYVKINDGLENKLRKIFIRKVEMSNTVDEYQFDCPDPEGGQARALAHKETDFYRILENLLALNQEEDIVNSVDDLISAKSYLIILRDDNKIQAIGFKTLPESWKMKKAKGFIPLMYKDNRFEDLD